MWMCGSTVLISDPVVLNTTLELTIREITRTTEREFPILSDGQFLNYIFLGDSVISQKFAGRESAHDFIWVPPTNSINKVRQLVGVTDELCHHTAYVELNTRSSIGGCASGCGGPRDCWKPTQRWDGSELLN